MGVENHTLGTIKDTSLAAPGQGLVEVRGEHGIRDASQVVVGQNIFLDGLATASKVSRSS